MQSLTVPSPHPTQLTAVIAYETGLPMEYSYGYNDIFCILFYTLVFIVTHGVIQQYLLDRSARKLHMSKIKHSKFNESGQLLTFYAASILWAVELLRRDRLTMRNFTETIGGPQDTMSYGTKLYFIVQIAYWLHCYPEFYLQKIRKEELSQRVFYVSLYLVSFLGAYVFNLTRLALVLVLFHYAGEAVFHLARILYFRQTESYPTAFKVWNGTFVASRLISITLSILVLALGLGTNQSGGDESQQTDQVTRSPVMRYFALFVILAIQIYLMWKYLVFHLGRMRPAEQHVTSGSNKNK